MQFDQILSEPGIDAPSLQTLLEARKKGEVDFMLVDVREHDEIRAGYIQGCDEYCPTSSFMQFVPMLKDTQKHIVLYCRSGGRTGQVLQYLNQEGLTNLSHLLGGISTYGGELVYDTDL